MPIPFACPHCNTETLVDDHYAGQSGPCVSCGKNIAVPYVPSNLPLDSDEIIVGIPGAGRKSVLRVLLVVIVASAAGLAVVGLLLALLFPSVRAFRAVVHRRTCTGNLERIGLALQAYEADYGTLPPAYLPDANGKPMHSWRVLLLPYLDQQGLYEKYDFSRPWDSPQNQLLARQIPEVYVCPGDASARLTGESSYLVLVGPETLFPGSTSVRRGQVSDRLATTLAVCEMPVAGNSWLEPKDLNLANTQFQVNGTFGNEIGSYHLGGANVLMADGKVRFLQETVPAEFVRGMATINGRERIPLEIFEEPRAGFD